MNAESIKETIKVVGCTMKAITEAIISFIWVTIALLFAQDFGFMTLQPRPVLILQVVAAIGTYIVSFYTNVKRTDINAAYV